MKNHTYFRCQLKPIYFFLFLLIWVAAIILIENKEWRLVEKQVFDAQILAEWKEEDNSTNEKITILFFSDTTFYSRFMEYQLAKVTFEKGWQANVFKILQEQHYDLFLTHQISGTPSTLIFKDGIEVCRLMGVIPAYNLTYAYSKINN